MLKSVFLIFLCALDYGLSFERAGCGDWVSYKLEKCYKIYKDAGLQTFDNAKSICNKEDSSLVTIRSEEEEVFLFDILKNNQTVNEVWLGAKRNPKTRAFNWIDDSNMTYTNWAEIKPEDGNECVEMIEIPNGVSKGKWTNSPCEKKNVVICQKLLSWTISKILDVMYKAKKELDQVKLDLIQSRKNIIPIGFIYVQLPNQSEPNRIWPDYNWNEVTSHYSNLFFRAAGDMTEPFGERQKENVPKIQIYFEYPEDYYSENRVAVFPKFLPNTTTTTTTKPTTTTTTTTRPPYMNATTTTAKTHPANVADFSLIKTSTHSVEDLTDLITKRTKSTKPRTLEVYKKSIKLKTNSKPKYKMQPSILALNPYDSGFLAKEITASQFLDSIDEVRPKNAAIRIWKRIH